MQTLKKQGSASEADVVIVGGGPVGLFLACCLVQCGVRCRVLEKRLARVEHSKAIGIHPVSLELFEKVGVAERVIDAGVRVHAGHAYAGPGRRLGTLRFSRLPGKYRFVIALPQAKTEQILEERLHELDSEALLRGNEVTRVKRGGEAQLVCCSKGSVGASQLEARWVVGCDGKHSLVRHQAQIGFYGRRHDDLFLMSDLEDRTDIGSDAAVFLHPRGVVESFPLPGNQRRWVVRVDQPVPDDEDALRKMLDALLMHRAGFRSSGVGCSMMSTFSSERFVAERFFADRMALAGDAAHILSPVGGQGLNLGWGDASALAQALQMAIRYPDLAAETMYRYQRLRRHVADRAIRRASIYTWVGAPRRAAWVGHLAVRAALGTPVEALLAWVFTMHGLGGFAI